MHDWQWGMPTENWGQTGSYIGPALPPALDPDAGTLIQLPCINRDYLPLLLGCLDQLRNPSSWDPAIGDNGLSLALNKWSRLRSMIGAAIGVSCMPAPLLRFTSDCHLQQSADGGVTWQTIPGWDANLDSCIKAHIPPQVPTNPRNDLTRQRACEIAGFLASEVIDRALSTMEQYVGTTNQQVAYARSALGVIAFAFPITNAAMNAFFNIYEDTVALLIAQIQSVVNDPAFWGKVTCAIYEAIVSVGYVDASNYAAAVANVHNVSYPAQPWAPNAVGNFFGNLGLGNVQALQASGAMDFVDCSACQQNNCFEWPFYSSAGPLWGATVPFGTWVHLQGWETTFDAALGTQLLSIRQGDGAGLWDVDYIELGIDDAGFYPGGGPAPRQLATYRGGVLQELFPLPASPQVATSKIHIALGIHAIDDIGLYWPSSADPGIVGIVRFVLMHSPTSFPFGGGCVDG